MPLEMTRTPMRPALPLRSRMAGRWIGAAIMALASLLALPASGQQMRAWDHGEYGRLVFDWGGSVPEIRLDNQGNRAVITSSQPIQRDITWILDYLSGYISDARSSDGGRTIVLDLTGPMRIDRLALNDRAAWDFRHDPSAATAAPQAPEQPVPDTSAEVASASDEDQATDGIAQQPLDPPAGLDISDVGGQAVPEGPEGGSTPEAETADAGDTGDMAEAPDQPDVATAPLMGDDEAAADAPAELPRLDAAVPVQAAPRLGYSRIVFDLPRRLDYRIENEGDLIGIVFPVSGEVDLDAVDPTALPEVRGAVQEVSDQGLIVAFALPDGVRVRDFAYGNRVVVDLLAPERGYVPAIAQPTPASPDAPAPAQTQSGAQTPGADDASGAGPVEPASTASDPADEAASEVSADSATSQETGDEAASTGTQATSVAQTLREAQNDAPGDTQSSEQDGEQSGSDGTGGTQATDDGSGEDPAEETGVGSDAVEDNEGVRPEAAPAAPVDQTVLARTATFDTGAPMALAAFVRGDALWVVFAGEDVSAGILADQGERGFGPATVAEARGGVALRFDGQGTASPVISREGTAWTVAVPEEPLSLGDTLSIQIQPDHPDGARLFVPVDGAQGPVAFIDPAVGDVLVAMPIGQVGDGVTDLQRFIEFRLLPSAQGLVIRPAADDLRVRGIDGGIVITAEGGLQLS